MWGLVVDTFGMPLDSEDEVIREVGGAYSFDDAIVSACGNFQADSRTIHRLVVRGIAAQGSAPKNTAERRAFRQIDIVVCFDSRGHSAVFEASLDIVGNVSEQGASHCDIDDLMPQTDAEDGFGGEAYDSVCEAEIEVLQDFTKEMHFRMVGEAVICSVKVRASDEEEGIAECDKAFYVMLGAGG